MAEKTTHKKVKSSLAGKTGRKEVSIKKGLRIDVMTKYKAVEVERGGPSRLEKAAQRLKYSRKPQKVLVVPSDSMSIAKKAMQKVGVSGTVRNLSDTKRVYVAKPTKPSVKKRRG